MTLRAATNADLPRIRALVRAVLEEHGLAYDPGGSDADLVDLEATYTRAGGSFLVLVAPDGELFGTVAIERIDARVCELRKMYLAKGARGRGHGRFLLERIVAAARASGFAAVRLETADVLRDAIALYQRFGFREIDEKPGSTRCSRVMLLDLAAT